ncbi:MAG: hypothetical protein KAH33_02615 [Candidatus Delongbacteria bacterium]|nr:hypothetical protein [Candidatus Delongbacteria bacterium]
MQKKLQQLTNLQTLDTKLYSIEKAKGNLPYLVNEFTKEIDVLNKELEESNDDFADTKKDLNESKTTIDESNILLGKYKDQRSMVTNNKEYEALVNEMAYRENLVEELTLKVTELDAALESKKELIEEQKGILEEKTANLSDKQQQLDEKLAETAEEENKLAEKRKKLVAKIDKQLYNLYERIYRSKNQAAVVSANEGHCGGCFTMLPSQKLSELKRKDSIVQCDTCSRILIYSFEDEDK